MSKDIKEFPDLSSKLAAPVKKSLFERQKAEAAEKRAREAADTAAAYEDFVKTFEGDVEEDDALSNLGGGARVAEPTGAGTRGVFGGGGAKRHFAPSGPKSLNSGPGSLGPPPPSLQSRKRPFDGAFSGQKDPRWDRDRGILGFDDEPSGSLGPMDTKTAFQTSDDEDDLAVADSKAAERAAAKPTLQLSQLPPGTSQPAIKALIPAKITVDSVRVLPPSGPGSAERRSMSAIVTMAADTPSSDIDAAVNSLQHRYLGYGFYLNISRHLSSAALGGGLGASALLSSNSSLPFGAKTTFSGLGGPLSRAPPPGSLRGGFAPPASYNNKQLPGPINRGQSTVQVQVTPPTDVKQLKLIHQTVEQLITHGPEFEALLMSRPSVQQEEKWSWIWDPRSPGGVWYRWRLWQALTGSNIDKKRLPRSVAGGDHAELLFDTGAPWQPPPKEDALRFEFTTKFEEFVSDPEYDSSDEDDSDQEGRRRKQQERSGRLPDDFSMGQESEVSYLNPLQKAKLTHLLARLPRTTGTLRKGDVARVTGFAISHAGAGAEEVVDMIVANVEQPLAWSGANPDRKPAEPSGEDSDEDAEKENAEGERDKKEKEDQTPSKLIALYVISDILSSSSTSGVRHAWKYRQLFENAIKARTIFENLGRLEKELQWGRMRAEKWKRSVNGVLGLWETWCVFSQKTQEALFEAFNNPPMTEAEKAEEERARERERAERAAKSKWKSVERVESSGMGTADASVSEAAKEEGNGGEAMEVDSTTKVPEDAAEADGEPMVANDLGVEPIAGSVLGGAPVDEVNLDGKPADEGAGGSNNNPTPSMEAQGAPESDGLTEAARARRQRPRAVDMFADSDGE